MNASEAVDVVLRADEAGYEPFRDCYAGWIVEGWSLAEYQRACCAAVRELLGVGEDYFARLVFDRVEKLRRDNVPLRHPEYRTRFTY